MPTSPVAGSQDSLRRNNLARLVRRLHEQGPATRSDLVALTGLNRSTVGALVAELADRGLVVERSGASGSVGRPSLVVAPVPESAVVLAFDLRVDVTIGAVVGLGGTVFARKEQRHRRGQTSPEAAVRHVVALAGTLLDAAPEGAAWAGTAVSVPGLVEGDTGTIRLAPNLGWVDAEFGRALDSALHREYGDSPPVIVGNDADFGAIAESLRGAGAGGRAVLYLNADIGVGGGILIDGRLMAGSGGFAGELGHVVVNPKGAACRCGRRGCWETEIGEEAIVRRAGGEPGSGLTVREIAERAEAGDARAQRALAETAGWLSLGVTNLVNLLNPDVVVVGGHLRFVMARVGGIVHEGIAQALPGPRSQVRVVIPALNGDSALLGAAESGFARLLADPAGVIAESGTLVAS